MFGCVFSVTVFEECNADKAIAEAVRVTRTRRRASRSPPCGRSICRNGGTSTFARAESRRKVVPTPRSVAANQVADASLFTAGCAKPDSTTFVSYPMLITLDRPDSSIWRYREDHVLSLLSPDELPGVARGARQGRGQRHVALQPRTAIAVSARISHPCRVDKRSVSTAPVMAEGATLFRPTTTSSRVRRCRAPGFFGAGWIGRRVRLVAVSEIGAEDEPLAAVSTLFAGLSGVDLLSAGTGVGAGALSATRRARGAGGANDAGGVGSVFAPTDVGRTDGGGGGTLTGAVVIACAGGRGGIVGDALISISALSA